MRKTRNAHKDNKSNANFKAARNNYSKGSRKSKSYSTDSELDSRTNDPSWYSTDPALLRDAASIPFSWSVGTTIDMQYIDIIGENSPLVVPGVMTLGLIPAYGRCENATSALNVAANSIYTFVRHANSGHSNYDAPDLMLYIGAMSQVYSFINWLQRVYGIASLYSQKNRYLPRTLLFANGVNPESVFNNLADFRYRLNLYINKAASLAVPANMPLFKRHAFLFQNVYCEGQSIKDQLYMYVPYSFMKFTYDEDGAGMLTDHNPAGTGPTVGNGWTVDELFRGLDEMLRPIITSEDMNIMSGDILKAYGTENLIKLTTVPEDYTVVPIFDNTVLEQFKNASPLPFNFTLGKLEVKQDKDKKYLTSAPTITTTGENEAEFIINNRAMQAYYSNRILSTQLDAPGPETVIESTRLMQTVDRKYLTDAALKSKAEFALRFGSELVRFCKTWTIHYNSDGSTGHDILYHPYIQAVNYDKWTSSTSSGNTPAVLSSARSVFKYHPAVQYIKAYSSSAKARLDGFDFGIDNYAVLTPTEIDRLHDTALLNMLHVPLISRV